MEDRAESERSSPPPSARAGLVRAAVILAGLGALLFIPVPLDNPALWFGAATDFLHVPIFAGLTYALARYCFPRLKVLVIVLAACIALGAEAVQPLVTRSASWRDAAYGLLGNGIAAAALATTLPRIVRTLIVLLLAAWPLWRTVPTVLDAFDGIAAFPVLADFDRSYSTRRWWLRDARLSTENNQAVLHTQPSTSWGSGAILLPLVRDWSAYDRLEFDFSFEGEPLVFLVSIRTGSKLAEEQSNYDVVKRYPSGRHHVAIDLAAMKPTGNGGGHQLDRIQSLLLIAFDDQPRRIEISPIKLSNER